MQQKFLEGYSDLWLFVFNGRDNYNNATSPRTLLLGHIASSEALIFSGVKTLMPELINEITS